MLPVRQLAEKINTGAMVLFIHLHILLRVYSVQVNHKQYQMRSPKELNSASYKKGLRKTRLTILNEGKTYLNFALRARPLAVRALILPQVCLRVLCDQFSYRRG